MNNATKMVLGILLMAAGVYWYIGNVPYFGSALWKSFKIVFEGVFGAFVFFIGLIVAWVAWDDYKMDKMLREEEAKEKTEVKEVAETKTATRKRAGRKTKKK